MVVSGAVVSSPSDGTVVVPSVVVSLGSVLSPVSPDVSSGAAVVDSSVFPSWASVVLSVSAGVGASVSFSVGASVSLTGSSFSSGSASGSFASSAFGASSALPSSLSATTGA